MAIYRERKRADAEAGLHWIDELGAGNRYVNAWAGDSTEFQPASSHGPRLTGFPLLRCVSIACNPSFRN